MPKATEQRGPTTRRQAARQGAAQSAATLELLSDDAPSAPQRAARPARRPRADEEQVSDTESLPEGLTAAEAEAIAEDAMSEAVERTAAATAS